MTTEERVTAARARADQLSDKRKKEIASQAANARWEKFRAAKKVAKKK